MTILLTGLPKGGHKHKKERNRKMNENYRNSQQPQEERPLGQYRPSLAFYRASAKGTGSAVKMKLHPAHDDTDGSIMLTIANQKTVGSRMGPNPTFSTFDWDNAMTIKLDFNDLTKMLQVFRGECETIEDGMGLCHLSPRGSTKIMLRHLVEPIKRNQSIIFNFSVNKNNKYEEF